MQIVPATNSASGTPIPACGSNAAAGPIRAFRSPVASGGAIDVLVWLEGQELVVKELSSLVRPARGERRVPIGAIRDVELSPCEAEQLLILNCDEGTLRLQAPPGVMQSLVRELADSAHLGVQEACASRPGFVGRVVGWLHGQ